MARTSPGATGERTGRSSTCSMYRATHSTASCACRRNSSGLIRYVDGVTEEAG